MKKILFVLVALSFGCSVSAEIENICVSRDSDLPGIDLGLDIERVNGQIVSAVVSREVEEDISDITGKIDDYADIELDFKNLSLSTETGDLSFIEEIETTATQDGKQIVVSDDKFSFNSGKRVKKISLHAKDDEGLVEMLKNGSVKLELNVRGKIPNETTEAKTDLCVGLTGEMN